MQVEGEVPSGAETGELVSNAYLTCPQDGDSLGKLRVIPDSLTSKPLFLSKG